MMNMMKGQTLIEAVLALGIAVVVITIATTTIISALGNAEFSKNQNTASHYAQEGLEVARQLHQRDYASFQTMNGIYCLAKGSTNFGTVQSDCTVANVDTFVRKVTFEIAPGCGNGITKVTSQVAWRDAKCGGNGTTYCHQASLVSCFSDTDVRSAP